MPTDRDLQLLAEKIIDEEVDIVLDEVSAKIVMED